MRLSWLIAITGLVSIPSASCTDLLLAHHRQDQLVREYRYTLGEKYTQVGDMRLCYQEHGQGPNLIILPGLCTNIDFWQSNIPVLAKRYHVWAIDPPGMGKSDKPEASYDLPWICENIVKFMDQMHIKRTSFIGGSLGGHLALLIAMKYPERTEKLILMGSCGAWPPPTWLVRFGLWALWNDDVVTDHLRRNWPNIYSKLCVRQTPFTQHMLEYQMAIRAKAEYYRAEGRATARSLRSIFFHSCTRKLKYFNRPTLLVWGESDQWHLREEALRFKAELPDCRLVIVPDSGHEVMIDQTHMFNDLVLAFLDKGWDGVDSRPLKKK